MSAQYLLRFDDLCPTMAREKWLLYEALIDEFRLQPILAVVPENHDPELACDPPDADFWPRMLALQQRGATIALHGYRHACASRNRGLVGVARYTEFAGVDESTQHKWIAAGRTILESHGLSPRVFVAPRHGLDRATLRVLRREGIHIVSDGFLERPYFFGGATWIPQQLADPVAKKSGVWTICIHSNTASIDAVARLRRFQRQHASQFTSVSEVLSHFVAGPLEFSEWVDAWAEVTRRRLRLQLGWRGSRRA